MKKNFKSFALMAAFTAVGLSSCSSDDIDGQSPINEGETTNIALSITSPKTYGTPQAGTAAESAVSTVDVFVYDAAGFLKDYKNFLASSFTEASGVWTSTTIMPTTTGAKQVYVAINLPAALAATLSGVTMGTMSNVAQALSVSDVATAGAFIMSSDVVAATFAAWDGTGTIPAANAVAVSVKRLASKFTLEEKATLNLANIDGGTLSNVQFAVGQINLSTFVPQKVVANIVQDPNFAAPATAGAGLSGVPATADYIAINGSGVAINALAAKYALENTNDNTLAGNLTYISVRAGFVPTQVMTGAAGSMTLNANANGLGDFYCIRTNVGNVYFNTLADATTYCGDYALNASTDIIKYTDGLCYYTVYVNKNNTYNVFRNDFYQAKVDNILGLGDNKEGPVDPDIKVGVSTNIKVEITVVPWNLETEEFDLTPQA